MVPVLTLTPPTNSRCSTTATRLPSLAAEIAARCPEGPDPRTSRSNISIVPFHHSIPLVNFILCLARMSMTFARPHRSLEWIERQARASHFRQYHKRMKSIVNRSGPTLATLIGCGPERNCCTPLQIVDCMRRRRPMRWRDWWNCQQSGRRTAFPSFSCERKICPRREQVELARAVVRAVQSGKQQTIASKVW